MSNVSYKDGHFFGKFNCWQNIPTLTALGKELIHGLWNLNGKHKIQTLSAAALQYKNVYKSTK